MKESLCSLTAAVTNLENIHFISFDVKTQIIDYGIDQFGEKCKESVHMECVLLNMESNTFCIHTHR